MASSPNSTSPAGRKLVSTKSGMRMICFVGEERSAFEIDEPHWQNDHEVKLILVRVLDESLLHMICARAFSSFSRFS